MPAEHSRQVTLYCVEDLMFENFTLMQSPQLMPPPSDAFMSAHVGVESGDIVIVEGYDGPQPS